MEYLSTLFISIIITVLGLELFKSSIKSLVNSDSSKTYYSTAAIVIMCVSVGLKIFLAAFNRIVGKKINSPSLIAASVDSIGDVAATSAVIAGIFLSPITGKATDGVLGCLIAGYIFFLGIKLIRESSDTLLGTAPDTGIVSEIITKLKSYEGVLGIHDLVMHNYGSGRFFASVHLEMDAQEDIMKSHDLIDNIESDFNRDLGIHLVIHLDPVNINDVRLNGLKYSVHNILDEISSEVSSPISMHDFRAVFGITHTNLIFDIAVSHDMTLSDENLCSIIKNRVKKLDPTYNAVITVDRDYTTTRFD